MDGFSKAVASMSGDSAVDGTGDISLTKRQEIRMREIYPIAYCDYTNGRRSETVKDAIRKVAENFTEPLHDKMIYYDATGDGVSFNKYKDKWYTYASGHSEIAWAYDGRETCYLSQFMNGAFVVGIMLDAMMVRALYMLHLTGEEQSTDSTCDGKDINFKCLKEADDYSIYMHNCKIVTLDEFLMDELACYINDRIPTPKKYIEQLLKTWITVQEEDT